MKTEFKGAGDVADEILYLLNQYTNDIVWVIHKAELKLTDYDIWFRAYYRGKDFGIRGEGLNPFREGISFEDQIRMAAASIINHTIRTILDGLDNDSSSLMIPTKDKHDE